MANLFHQGGIDEAGLGPILGPYCGALSLFQTHEKKDLYQELAPLIQREPHDQGLAVGDSKKIYTPKKGLAELEKTVLAFYLQEHPLPSTLKDFFSTLMGNFHRKDFSEEYYESLEDRHFPYTLSREVIISHRDSLRTVLAQRGISLKSLRLAVLPALAFNKKLDQHKNKATLCQEILSPLLKEAFIQDKIELVVDRQGGRKFYGDWLLSLLPGCPIQAFEESVQRSVYHSKGRKVQFVVKGDSQHFEVALASMFAKYARELLMEEFNRYWLKKCPGIKGTAGYYSDGKRFLSDLRSRGISEEEWKRIVRKK